MDYVDFIVHVFSAGKRAFYGLERLRKSATVLSIADLNAEMKATITASRKRPPSATIPIRAATPKKAAGKASAMKPALKKTAAKKTPIAKEAATKSTPSKPAIAPSNHKRT
jgi:ribosome-associated protein